MSVQTDFDLSKLSSRDTGIDTLSPEPVSFKREFFRINGKIYRVDNSHNRVSFQPATKIESVVYENMPVLLTFGLKEWLVVSGMAFPLLVAGVLLVRFFRKLLTN